MAARETWLPDTALAREYPEAAERAQQVLLALYDLGPLTTREVIDQLSSPMSRADADSANHRLLRSGAAVLVPDTHPQQYTLTSRGMQFAALAVEHGASY